VEISSLDSKKLHVHARYRWIKKFVTFLSSRVTKKNPSKRLKIKFCLMRTMTMDKTERPRNLRKRRKQINIWVQDGIWDFIMQYGGWHLIYHVKMTSPQNSFCTCLWNRRVIAMSSIYLFLRSATPFCLRSVNTRWLMQDSILFQKLTKVVVQIFFSIIKSQNFNELN